jgi:glyoxylase-like metal-dependent hydrolase (beta-lactamase superfamily II)/rhodanese-related sulfurtransferase
MTDMFFKQMLHDDCGCSTYVVGGKSTNEVAVIDPGIDIQDVLELAEMRGFRVRYAIDTHIHADHVSGARKLAAATGAEVCMFRSADVRFPFRPLDEGEELALGNVSLRVMHTPGHRPEAICLLVTNSARAEAPSMVITGDTLLVGDVGRPDFGGEEGAADQWASIQRLLALEDYVEVFPSHFEGPCGKGMCGRPSSTIGFERRFNPALQIPGRAEFIAIISSELPARPLNMDAIIANNVGERDTPWVMPAGQPHVDEVLLSEAPGWVAAHQPLIVDVREPHEYQSGHLPGALSIPQSELADRLDEVPRDRDVLTVCQAGSRSIKSAQFLKQVGYGRVASLHGGTGGWSEAGYPVEGEPVAV